MADLSLQELFDIRRGYLNANFQAYQGKDFSAETVVKSINRAKRSIEKALYLFDPLVTLHLHEDDGTYDLENAGSNTTTNDVSKEIWLPLYVYIKKVPLYQADRRTMGLWKPHEFLQGMRNWFDTTVHGSGTPSIAVFYNTRRMELFLPPDADCVDYGGHYMAGFIVSADFTITNDADDLAATLTAIPRDVQEDVGIMAAIKDALPTMTETEQWRVFGQLRADSMEKIKELGDQNKSQIDNANSVFSPQVTMHERVGWNG